MKQMEQEKETPQSLQHRVHALTQQNEELQQRLRQQADRLAAYERAAGDAASEQQLRDITDTLPALIAYVDADQRCRFHNRAYQESCGLSSEELLGKSMRELMEPAFYESLRHHVEEVLAGYPVVYERKQRLANGDVRDYMVNYVPRYGDGKDEGKVIGFYSLGTDITELKPQHGDFQEVYGPGPDGRCSAFYSCLRLSSMG